MSIYSKITGYPKKASQILTFSVIVLMLAISYQTGLLTVWTTHDTYGHGLMAFSLLAYIVYRKWNYPTIDRPANSIPIVFLITTGVGFLFLSLMTNIKLLGYYGIWLYLVAIIYATGGQKLLRYLFVPLIITLLLFPVPTFLNNQLTTELQFISSQLGVWLIRLFGGIVLQQGNVIDMGTSRLLVAEACSGLRYLFPLLGIGLIAAYVIETKIWVRALILLSTIPITIFLNSLRIAITGILVDKTGTSHVEGFLHFFEGWVIFVLALVFLVFVSWALLKIFHPVFIFSSIFELPDKKKFNANKLILPNNTAIPVALSLALLLVVNYQFNNVDTQKLVKQSLDEYPLVLQEWVGKSTRLLPTIEAVAGATDY